MTTRLRPPDERAGAGRPTSSTEPDGAWPPSSTDTSGRWPAWTSRSLPARPVLFAALVVLVGLAVWRPGAPAAVVGLPLALFVPGAIVARRYLRDPGRATTSWARWFGFSIGWWVIVAGGVALGRVPVFSGWTVGAGALLAVAVLVSDPGGRAHWGTVSVRSALTGVVVIAVAVAVVFGARGLAWFAGSAQKGGGPVAVAFADPDLPVALSPTGAQASIQLVVINRGDVAVRPTVTVQVGAGLIWTTETVEVSPGRRATIAATGGVLVCREAQQLGVTIDGDTAPVLTAVIPGAIDAAACPTG